MLGGLLDFVVAREPFVGHALEHEVASLERAVGMAARIVIRGAANHGHQQRELVQLELGQRFAEIELAREPEAVDRARAVLAEIDLVDVRVQQLALAVPHLEGHRHERFAELAPHNVRSFDRK